MLNPKRLQTVQFFPQAGLSASRPKIGYIEQAISPNGRGRVRYQATCWFAICDDGRSLPKGTEVTIVGRRGNTLIVEPSLSC